jgi:hypothetical protein
VVTRRKTSTGPRKAVRKKEGQRKTPAVPQAFAIRIASNYNRAQALAFARQYWNLACPDLYIGTGASPFLLQVPAGTSFQRNATGPNAPEVAVKPDGSTIPFSQMDDCAHFISSCLGTPPNASAGGLNISSDFAVAYGIFGAQRLFNYLNTQGAINVIGTNLSHDDAAAQLSSLNAGDLIFYAPQGGSIHHSGLFLGSPSQNIACHTYCRADQVTGDPPQGWDSVAFTDGSGSSLVTVYTLAQLV